MKNKSYTIYLLFLIILTFCAALVIYISKYSEMIVDYVAFFGGIFLAVEAVYKIYKDRQHVLSKQVCRGLRALIGTCIFAIHTLQFMR